MMLMSETVAPVAKPVPRPRSRKAETVSASALRLADEYDAARERGEISKAGGDKSKLPDENFATVTDIGLTHKDIHEARKPRNPRPSATLSGWRVEARDVTAGLCGVKKEPPRAWWSRPFRPLVRRAALSARGRELRPRCAPRLGAAQEAARSRRPRFI
jgi:hypothetical protein